MSWNKKLKRWFGFPEAVDSLSFFEEIDLEKDDIKMAPVKKKSPAKKKAPAKKKSPAKKKAPAKKKSGGGSKPHQIK